MKPVFHSDTHNPLPIQTAHVGKILVFGKNFSWYVGDCIAAVDMVKLSDSRRVLNTWNESPVSECRSSHG